MAKLHNVLALAATALAFTLGTPTSAFSQSHRDPCAGLRGWDYSWCVELLVVHRAGRRISRRHAKDEKRRIARRERNIEIAVQDVIYSRSRAALEARLRRAHAQPRPPRAIRHSRLQAFAQSYLGPNDLPAPRVDQPWGSFQLAGGKSARQESQNAWRINWGFQHTGRERHPSRAVEYTKVCSLYGEGFFYVPGTDTCVKVEGWTRVESGARVDPEAKAAYQKAAQDMQNAIPGGYLWGALKGATLKINSVDPNVTQSQTKPNDGNSGSGTGAR